MTKIHTKHHVLKQEHRGFCWTIYPKGWPELASSTETSSIKNAIKQVRKLEEDLRKLEERIRRLEEDLRLIWRRI